MDSTYRPQSPDLSSFAPPDHSSYAPRSPDLSGLQPESPDPSGPLLSPRYGHHHSHSRDRFGNAFPTDTFAPTNYQGSPTSVPLQPSYGSQQGSYDMPPTTRRMKAELTDNDRLPDAPGRTVKQEPQLFPASNGSHQFGFDGQHSQMMVPPHLQGMPAQPPPDPTLGVQLKTSFPVARIKRIMQADDDIGKVAQVTPHVVSRALELFMIKIISASAAQAAQTGGGSGKGPKRILAQHVKKALQADESFDFLVDIIAKVPDAPTKTKKEQVGSDSEDAAGGEKVVKRRGKKKRDSGDD